MITYNDYLERRARLLSQMAPDSMAILPAAPAVIRNGDAHYRYRQNSDFYYLTGFKESDAWVILIKEAAGTRTILFNLPHDEVQELWNGPRVGQDGAVNFYGFDEAYSVDQCDERIPTLMENKTVLYFPMSQDPASEQRILAWVACVSKKVRRGIAAPSQLCNICDLIHEMRLIKSPNEQALMSKVSEISAHAHLSAMKMCKPGLHEYELHAHLLQGFYQGGCQSEAYDSIVGGGAHSCILHYIDNRALLKDGDLVLVDAGGELDYYAADITRTYPVNGRFSEAQAQIYQWVLDAQLAAIELIKPGVLWTDLQSTIVRILTKGLLDLGLLKGDLSQLVESKAYLRFYMHNSGHWLGLDVHDAGSYKQQGQWRVLSEGMVLTVEPGLYIRAAEDIDPKWWHIGVRIEDDVLVTAQGHRVLTQAAVKSIQDIEQWMA